MNLEFLIVRIIYENKYISQRDLADKYYVSLGKINATINKVVDDGLIERVSTTTYSVTNKGMIELEKHKVDGALILACGMGVRLAPLTYDTPKPFLKINGERMIERQIRQLQEAGINDITIMVGFMKEKFDYLIDKYKVKLIYNEEYKYKNTLATLYHGKDIIANKNMYICVADVYMTENLYHRYEVEPYYIGAFYKDCKNEWRYIVDSKNQIKAVAVGGSNDFCLVGPSFLTKEFLSVFLPLIDKYYKESFTDNYYWEDVLVQNFKNLPPIYLYKIPEKRIYEFDSLHDLDILSNKRGNYGSEAISFAARALNIDESDMENIICIKEGMTNSSYRFTYGGEEYIARVPGENTGEFVDRKTEGEILSKLKNKSITEDVIYYNDKDGYKLSRFFKNARTLNIDNRAELEDAMALYKRFHLLGIEVEGTCSMPIKVDEYINIVKEKNIYVPYEDYDEILIKAKKIMNLIRENDRIHTLCHGDPNPNNILVTSDGLKMIDFEYGGMANPLSDIALFGAYIKYDIPKTFELYKMYKSAKCGEDTRIIPENDSVAYNMIASYLALGGLYNALWAMVRTGLSDADYGTFGMDGYRVFKNCYKEMNID